MIPNFETDVQRAINLDRVATLQRNAILDNRLAELERAKGQSFTSRAFAICDTPWCQGAYEDECQAGRRRCTMVKSRQDAYRYG